jgi:hypothetical protein
MASLNWTNVKRLIRIWLNKVEKQKDANILISTRFGIIHDNKLCPAATLIVGTS